MRYLIFLFVIPLLVCCKQENSSKNQTVSTGDISIRFHNTLKDYPVQVFTEDKKGKEVFVSTIGADAEMEINDARPDQIYYFKPKGNSGYEILPYTVDSIENQKYTLALAQKRYGEAKNAYKRITNAMANRYSFDIVKIDPFKIDADESRGGGRKKLLFEELSDFDRDWYPFDGDFAVKNQFDVQFINEGKSTERSELFKSMSRFQDEYSASIGMKGTYKGICGTGSASWGKLTNNSQSSENFFSWFRKEDQKYFIRLMPDHAKLTEEFQEQVANLPVPKSLPETLKEAQTNITFDDYAQFVKDWGTHYPTKVTYGGIIQGSKDISRTQISDLVVKQFSFGVKAGVNAPFNKAEQGVGGKYSEKDIEEIEKITESSHKEYVYKGGEGYFELWAVGDEVQPIYINLESLTELLAREFLPEHENLIAKRTMLQFAIEEYLSRFPLPSDSENQIIAYEMQCFGITFPNSSDADRPYHTLDRIRVSMWPGINKKMVKQGTRYVLNKNGVVVNIDKGNQELTIPEKSRKKLKDKDELEEWTEPLEQPKMIFMINPKELPKSERDKIGIRFYANFHEDDGYDKKDEVASASIYDAIMLKDVNENWKNYTLEVRENGKNKNKSKLNANVYYKIRRIDLFE